MKSAKKKQEETLTVSMDANEKDEDEKDEKDENPGFQDLLWQKLPITTRTKMAWNNATAVNTNTVQLSWRRTQTCQHNNGKQTWRVMGMPSGRVGRLFGKTDCCKKKKRKNMYTHTL